MNDNKAVHKVECPCCYGKGFLLAYEHERLSADEPPKFPCTHCMGKGFVMSEIAAEREYEAGMNPVDDAEFGCKP